VCEDAANFLDAEYHRDAMRHFRPRQLFNRSNLDPEHVAIEKQQGTERLILCRCAHASRGRKPRQECCDLGGFHRRRMLLVVKDDESPDPVDVRVLGPPAIVPCSDSIPHAIEKLRWRSRLGRMNDRWGRETVGHVRMIGEQHANTIAAEKPNESSVTVVRHVCFCHK
jgi:hypothetical protein